MAELLPGMLQISTGSDETLSQQLTRQLRSLITGVPSERQCDTRASSKRLLS